MKMKKKMKKIKSKNESGFQFQQEFLKEIQAKNKDLQLTVHKILQNYQKRLHRHRKKPSLLQNTKNQIWQIIKLHQKFLHRHKNSSYF